MLPLAGKEEREGDQRPASEKAAKTWLELITKITITDPCGCRQPVCGGWLSAAAEPTILSVLVSSAVTAGIALAGRKAAIFGFGPTG